MPRGEIPRHAWLNIRYNCTHTASRYPCGFARAGKTGVRKVRFLYSVAYLLGFIVTFPYWLARDLARGRPCRFTGRFYTRAAVPPKQPGRPRVWLWALSSGEILAAKKLVHALEKLGAEVLISTSTYAGRDEGARIWPERLILPSPLDFTRSVNRFIDFVDPDLFLLVETDIWPCVLWQLHERDIPAVLLSARISPESLGRYVCNKRLFRSVFGAFSLITVHNGEDRQRFIIQGIPPEKVAVTGDLKLDGESTGPFHPYLSFPERAALLRDTGWPDGRWIVAGSTHDGEEAIILDVFCKLNPGYPGLKLLIAPRNKYDFPSVRAYLEGRNLSAAYHSLPEAADGGKDIFILDSFGELSRFYSLAEIALVGKSWEGRHRGGGHNILEPAAKGKPVLFGPLMHNYAWLAERFVRHGGGRLVPDKKALYETLDHLLTNPEEGRKMGKAAYGFVQANCGGTERTLEALRPIIEAPESSGKG